MSQVGQESYTAEGSLPTRTAFPWRRLVGVVVVVLAVAFLAVMVRDQWSALQTYAWQLSPAWALLALLLLETAWLIEVDTWRSISGALGGPIPFRRALQLWFYSNILRYLPGNVWQFLGMAEMAAEDGVPRMVTFTGIALHQVVSTAAGVAVAALYFALAGGAVWLERLRPALLLMPLALLLLQPRLLEWFLNSVLSRLGRAPIRVTLTWGQVWILLARYAVVWLVMGLGFAALVRSLAPVNIKDVPYLVASWAAAYAIGYLTMLTPAGLGVREGVLALLMSSLFPTSVAAVVAIIARLWMVAGELVGVVLAAALAPKEP